MDLQFGIYRLDNTGRRLLGPSGPLDLSARAYDILALLLSRPDAVVAKAEILDAVWPGLVVEDNTLQVHMSALRKALGEGMIATVHGRGYKYAGPRPTAAPPPPPQHESEPAAGSRPSIAILPFENRSGDPEQDYFSDGITEDIIAGLGRFKEFLVIARNSAFRFRNGATDIAEVARTLDVQYVVQGSVRKSGNRVRVTVQLVDAAQSAHVWGEHYDRDLTDIFAIQDEITQMIAARLARQTRTAAATRARVRPTANMSAYDLYQRALPLAANYTTVSQAEPLLHQAIALDPGFAAAHALSGFVQSIRFFWTVSDASLLHRGLDLAARALQLDPDETYGHLSTGFACLYLRRFRQAETGLDHALALNPNDPFILTIRALLLNYTGRPGQGLADLDAAQRRDPFAVGWYDDFRGICLTTAGRYREAADLYQGMQTITPWSLGHLTICLCELGEPARARDMLARFKATWPGESLDQIITHEMGYFEDPAVIARYRAILHALDAAP